jgi:hypothetical protein
MNAVIQMANDPRDMGAVMIGVGINHKHTAPAPNDAKVIIGQAQQRQLHDRGMICFQSKINPLLESGCQGLALPFQVMGQGFREIFTLIQTHMH